MTAAMILAAGLGTRLRPLTDVLAKPMVPIGDRAAIAHVHDRIVGVASRVVVNVHHRPADVIAWADASGVVVSHEPELLGTAGGVAKAAALLGDGNVLVWNGDILSPFDPELLTACHLASGAEATLAFAPDGATGTGNIGVGADGRVVRLRDRAFPSLGPEVASGRFVGIHVLGPRLRGVLPAKGCLVADVYLPALARGARLAALAVTTPFADIGDLASYVAANRAWLTTRGLTSWSSPGTVIDDGVSIEGSIVGAGAEIHADCTQSIVWPAVAVLAPVHRAIVTRSGAVPIGDV